MASTRNTSFPPGLGSYRGRYLYLSILVILALSLAGGLGYRNVSEISRQNLQGIQARAEATALLHDAVSQLQELQSRLGGFLLTPPRQTAENLRLNTDRLALAIGQLRDSAWIRGETDMRLLTDSVAQDQEVLREQIEQLIYIRSDRHRWLPATVSIENELNPITVEAQGILAEIMDELEETPRDEESQAVRRIVNQMRLHWLQAISEVRLIVINRFGVFGSDTHGGMAVRAQNTRTYLSEFDSGLAQLERFADEGLLGFLAVQQLQPLKEASARFEQAMVHTLDRLTKYDWRPDLALVQDDIEPMLDTLGQRLASLRLELDIQSARNITDMTEVSRQLTEFVVVLIGAGALFALLAYLMFDRMLLRPIQQTTQALKLEARGEHADEPPEALADETRDLVEAFEEMRRQVRRRQDHLDHLAHHDILTGLPNRLLFRDRLEHAVALTHRSNTMLAVLFLDLDRFKQINDSLGHAAGDTLLQVAAQRLRGSMRESDTVARLGGDEFAILAEGISRREEITRLAEKVIACLEEPFVIEGRTLHISTSIGITLCPNDGQRSESLLQGADAAMYEAKRAGKGLFRFFTAEMTRQATEYLNLETHLRAAVAAEAFELHFQPIAGKDGQHIGGCEALLRWQHPEDGYISPEVFIPVLDDMGQMGRVSRWIMQAIHQQQQRLAAAGHDLTIGINLTARLLHDEQFADYLLQALREKRPDPTRLMVEITEDTLTQDLEAAERVLRQLNQLGVRIALDDFGTGQSSLNHLRRYPFDVVKIDREFIRDIPGDPNDVDLVRAIIQLSHAFGMGVVAEGVETVAQAELLQAMNCDRLQGYLISRPVTPDGLMELLTSRQPIGRQQA